LAAAVDVEVSCEVEGRSKAESGIKLGADKREAELGPRAKEDPGSVPGFEHSVNAEPGSMGAGAGAAATIVHNEPSPCGAAIEKAQAELRFPNTFPFKSMHVVGFIDITSVRRKGLNKKPSRKLDNFVSMSCLYW
jgi:hypothetical protein